jgi:uncharacterized protein (UPF0212 family)
MSYLCGDVPDTVTSGGITIVNKNDGGLVCEEMLYGQTYCPQCGGNVDTMFRCMNCGCKCGPLKSYITKGE